MVDQLKNDTNDIVKLEEAKQRAAQIITEDLKYHYTLALRMGETFIGQATIEFKAVSKETPIWINVSVAAIG